MNALICYEAGKTWPEADADTAETIDFCEYYGREMLRLAGPQQVVPMKGEKNYLVYIPLGVGVVIPPWNFPAAIAAGMTMASLVTGNTVVLKPAGDTPTVAAKFVDIAYEAGIPKDALSFLTGPGASVGDVLVKHPKTRYIAFTGSKEVGLRISELAGKTVPGQIWIKRTVLEMGGKDSIIVDEEGDVDAAVEGVAQAAFGYQGQKCSACSRAIVSEKIYDTFVQKLVDRTKKIAVGPSEDPNNYMGPVVSKSAMNTILNYIEVGKKEGNSSTAAAARPATAISFSRPSSPTSIPWQESRRKKSLAPSSPSSKRRISITPLKSPTTRSSALPAPFIQKIPKNSKRRRNPFTLAISTLTANAPARWSALIRSADSTCPARIPKPAEEITCFYFYRRKSVAEKLQN